jgi:TetR/AcrR family transcriptional regulator, transcriptional repressor for nem operon
VVTVEGLRAWRDMLITAAQTAGGIGGCPPGSLGSQLAESDPQARAASAVQGGLLLAQVQRDVRPLQTAVDTIIALVGGQSVPGVGAVDHAE